MNMPDAVRSVLSKYATFSGRATRSEYWWFYLASVIAYIVASIIDAIATQGVLAILVVLALIIPSLSVGARRLHDTDRTGWWQLIGLIPIIGTIVLIVFYVMDSGPDNKYGPNPKAVGPAGYGGYGQVPPAPGQYPA